LSKIAKYVVENSKKLEVLTFLKESNYQLSVFIYKINFSILLILTDFKVFYSKKQKEFATKRKLYCVSVKICIFI